MKRSKTWAILWFVGTVGLFVAVWYHSRTSSRRESTKALLDALYSSGLSECVCQGKPYDTLVSPEALRNVYLGTTWTRAEMQHLLGTNAHLPFRACQGPRSEQPGINAEFEAACCADIRALLWGLAMSYAQERSLGWTQTVSVSQVLANASGWGKITGICPSGTQVYPPFRLVDGPVCPHLPASGHHLRKVPPVHVEFFRQDGTLGSSVVGSRRR